jgi:hypothetical protein
MVDMRILSEHFASVGDDDSLMEVSPAEAGVIQWLLVHGALQSLTSESLTDANFVIRPSEEHVKGALQDVLGHIGNVSVSQSAQSFDSTNSGSTQGDRSQPLLLPTTKELIEVWLEREGMNDPTVTVRFHIVPATRS